MDLFRESEDFQEFLRLLHLFTTLVGCTLWAYALMSNHYHLILYGSSAQLTELMKRVNHEYALYHNRKYLMSGHLLEGPYNVHPLRSPFLLLRKIAYVLLNPFKAGMETQLGRYPWTSLPDYLGTGDSPLPLSLASLWAYIGADASSGRERFEKALALEQAKPSRKKPGLLTALEAQEQEFEWLLEHAFEQVPFLKGEDPVDVACYWGRLAGIAPRAMARHLGHEGTGMVRSALWRFRKKLAQNPDLERSLPLP